MSHDLHPAILESDSKGVVELTNSPSSGQAEVDVFIGELKALLSSLQLSNCVHGPRTANSVAHMLARKLFLFIWMLFALRRFRIGLILFVIWS